MQKEIKINTFFGIKRNDANHFVLPFSDNILNHVNTAHAGAQFCLAEVASGKHLEDLFPDLKDKVYAVLRRANVKYNAPGKSQLTAIAAINDSDINDFKKRLIEKTREVITVSVELFDINQKKTFTGNFEWFLQLLKK